MRRSQRKWGFRCATRDGRQLPRAVSVHRFGPAGTRDGGWRSRQAVRTGIQHHQRRSDPVENTWPKIARYFGMPTGPRRQISLVDYMADKGPVWDDREEARATAVQLPGNRCVGLTATLSSRRTTTSFQISARRASGFHESVDTEEMFFRLWDEMRRAYYSGLIPAFDHFAPLLDLAPDLRGKLLW